MCGGEATLPPLGRGESEKESAPQLATTASEAPEGAVEGMPCSEYRVNLFAQTFGECKCGFPKKDHATS